MKHKISCFLYLALVFCLAAPTVAFAANETDHTMNVTYTQNEDGENVPRPTPPSDPVFTAPTGSTATYEVNIPANYSLNETDSVYINLAQYDFQNGQTLTIYIDGDRTFSDDGYLHLTAPDQNEDAILQISRYLSTTNLFEVIKGSGLHEVAVFTEPSRFPTDYGQIRFELLNGDDLKADTYSGQVYFRIELTNS